MEIENIKEQREQFINEMLEKEISGTKRDKILSLRVEKYLFQALEQQAEEWNLNISETIRNILNLYFAPIALEAEWKELEKDFDFERMEYLEFARLNLIRKLDKHFEKTMGSIKFLFNESGYLKEVEKKLFEREKRKLEEITMKKLEFNEVQ